MNIFQTTRVYTVYALCYAIQMIPAEEICGQCRISDTQKLVCWFVVHLRGQLQTFLVIAVTSLVAGLTPHQVRMQICLVIKSQY